MPWLDVEHVRDYCKPVRDALRGGSHRLTSVQPCLLVWPIVELYPVEQ